VADTACAIADFCEVARAEGLDVTPETVVIDGPPVSRCDVNGEHGEKNGAYHVFSNGNGFLGAWFQNHKGGDVKTWCSRTKNEIPRAEWNAIRARIDAGRKKQAEELAQARAEAAASAEKRWGAAKEYEHHPYTDGKGILPHSTRVDHVDGEDRILVPVRDVDGKLHGLQRITSKAKLFTSGTAVTGNFFVIGTITGRPGERVVEVEGFGTGAAVHESTGHPVVVAFDCGNLLPVARKILAKYPQVDLAICADDDWKKPGNPGVSHATETEKETGARLIIPKWTSERPEKSTDMDDLARDEDRNVVKQQIEAAFTAEKPGAEEPNNEPEDDGDGKSKRKDKKCPTQSQVLIRIARDQCDLFHCEREAYATTGDGATHAVRSKGFRMFLGQRFFCASGRAPSSQALHEAIDTIEACVVSGEAERVVALRVGEEEEKIYIDLATDDYQLVEVDRNDWRIVAHSVPALRFRRSSSMRPVPGPTRDRTLDDLRTFLTVDDEGWRLSLPWLIYTLQPRGPFPILALGGEQGAAKTTTAKMLRALVDPSQAAVRAQPKDDDQLFVGVRGSWVLVYDNLSGMPPWLSDCLCGLATGTAQSKRTLYTDAEEHIIEALRPVIVNGIDDLTARPDFASRSLSITLSAIPEDKRREESALWAEFEAARPGIFGAMLTALAKVLATRREIRLDKLPRMADFARFGIALEGVLGWPDGSFLEAYEASQRASATTTMESNLVALAIQRLMENDTTDIRSTATDLLPRLAGYMTVDQLHNKHWPTNASQLGNQLRRVSPALRQHGISITQTRVRGDRFWRLTRTGVTGGDTAVLAAVTPKPSGNIGQGDGVTGGDGGSTLGSEKRERGEEIEEREATDTKEKRPAPPPPAVTLPRGQSTLPLPAGPKGEDV
jgi:phage/plasmid primase-like uncharacterized protein